jgi:hypothetical protein
LHATLIAAGLPTRAGGKKFIRKISLKFFHQAKIAAGKKLRMLELNGVAKAAEKRRGSPVIFYP